MYLHDPPIELKCLNNYEELLIQLAKCFMTIIQLKTCKTYNNQSLTIAIKG